MAHSFAYHRPVDPADAASHLARADAAPLGGGTDLLVLIGEGLARPAEVVDLRALEGADGVRRLSDGTLRIGAATRLHDVAIHPEIAEGYPALAQACEAVGTPTLRRMGTLGGNLCQRPRCWYFRRGIPCHKNGGDACPAHDGENQYHAILDGGPCWAVHPSDAAVALLALDAIIEVATPDGMSREVPVDAFYALPSERLDQETTMGPGEYVTAVHLPPRARGGRQTYRKLMQRGSWDFALASIAATRREDGEVRLTLGGVAPRPWRVNSSIEEDVSSGGLDDDIIATLADRALYDAEPLSRNGYKVAMAASLIRDAIRFLEGRE